MLPMCTVVFVFFPLPILMSSPLSPPLVCCAACSVSWPLKYRLVFLFPFQAFQLGPTEASYYWVYWVPTQYVDAIKDTVLGKWQYFWKHFHLWPRRLTQSEGHCWERPAASLDFRVLELCSKISISNLRWCGDWSQRWCTFTIFFFCHKTQVYLFL